MPNVYATTTIHNPRWAEQGIQITLAYNIGVFVVRHFCHDETEERIGELTGILVGPLGNTFLGVYVPR